jgi:uncharacterized protein YbbC (DUF1343 family)
MKKHFVMFIALIFSVIINKNDASAKDTYDVIHNMDTILVGAKQFDAYFDLLKGKKIGLVINHTAIVDSVNLLDTLVSLKLDVRKIFVPEHGFRGNEDAGASIDNSTDAKTGISIISLYGKNRKPSKADMDSIDVVIFDIQDVGVRFYTYISTLHYVMESCAENRKKLIVLDRPNPNGEYVDGPVLDTSFRSFVGMHPIAMVHGLTIGELAMMINGEAWLANKLKCDLSVIKVKSYTHSSRYVVPVKPSPNLPNHLSIRLYPSLGLFEATNVSIGRGTLVPFQIIGYPKRKMGTHKFTPVSIKGMSMNPPQKDKVCYGVDLTALNDSVRFSLSYFLEFGAKFKNKAEFVTNPRWLNLLTGNANLSKQILEGKSEEEIRKSWEPALSEYKLLRKKYLLYAE